MSSTRRLPSRAQGALRFQGFGQRAPKPHRKRGEVEVVDTDYSAPERGIPQNPYKSPEIWVFRALVSGINDKNKLREADVPDQARIRAAGRALREIQNAKRLTQEKLADEIGISVGTVAKLLAAESNADPTAIQLAGLVKIEAFIAKSTLERGFITRDVYLEIARGMEAVQNNEEFAGHYAGSYCVLRAHVPSTRPLMSKLIITVDPDKCVLRYKHFHKVSDALSLVKIDQGATTTDADMSIYEGFVFNCGNRAFLLATAKNPAHAKEMILNLRTTGSDPAAATIRGLLLTLSADEREPFASRVLVQKMTEKQLATPEWCPGLKDSWDIFAGRKEILREFSKKQNFGLLRLHA